MTYCGMIQDWPGRQILTVCLSIRVSLCSGRVEVCLHWERLSVVSGAALTLEHNLAGSVLVLHRMVHEIERGVQGWCKVP